MIELRAVRSLLEKCEVFDRVGVVRRMLGEMKVKRAVLLEERVGVVRSMLGGKVSD